MKKPLFHIMSNTSPIMQLVLVSVVIGGLGWLGYIFFTYWPETNDVAQQVDQPVPFSHQHHIELLKIDCGYCHPSTGTCFFAGMPSSHTCMTCHSRVWKESPVLAPVRESYRTGQPLRWGRVYSVPQFAYFSHAPHSSAGINCTECHGQVQEMPTLSKIRALNMKDCLSCHKADRRLMNCYTCHR